MEPKVFNDPIHGHAELSGLSCSIIDTPQFQRLRDISQLGGSYYVFPGASSNRFEHSLGVARLARNFVKQLSDSQPYLGITYCDSLCVEVAGLCHDLGHGPFSHLFDGRVLPVIYAKENTNNTTTGGSSYNHNHEFVHEHASIGILDILIEENNLMPVFKQHGLDDRDINFIKELILGDPSEAPPGFNWYGRGHKTFLYDIVANKRNGIDVDKFDYFARDCYMLGVTKSFDSSRLMQFARVCAVSYSSDGKSKFNKYLTTSGASSDLLTELESGKSIKDEMINLEICYHIKEAWNVFELFHTRYALHKRAYQHRVCQAVELMIAEALILADPYIFINGKDGAQRTMSQCPNDLHAYWKLTEYILRQIEHSNTIELKPARNVINRLRKRDLFCFSAEIILTPQLKDRLTQSSGGSLGMIVKEQLWQIKLNLDVKDRRQSNSDCVAIEKEDIFCNVVKLGYGKGKNNPVDLTTFYKPNKQRDDGESVLGKRKSNGFSQEHLLNDINDGIDVGVVPQDSISRLTPREFEETFIRIFSRHKQQREFLKEIFHEWCRRNSALYDIMSPYKADMITR